MCRSHMKIPVQKNGLESQTALLESHIFQDSHGFVNKISWILKSLSSRNSVAMIPGPFVYKCGMSLSMEPTCMLHILPGR